MARRLSETTNPDVAGLREKVGEISGCSSAQLAAQRFVDGLYGAFGDSLVLLRLFITVPYGQLPQEERLFMDRRGEELKISHLINGATPILTLLGTRGALPEWNDRHRSRTFRCIPLASTAFVASLSMLSRFLGSIGFDLSLVDRWKGEVAPPGRAGRFRGQLHIGDAASDRDEQGRLIVPAQGFVADHGVRAVLGCGCGYAKTPALMALFAFTGETFAPSVAEPLLPLLEAFRDESERLVREGRIFDSSAVAVP